MDPWICHWSAGATAGGAAGAAAVYIYYVRLGGALRATLHVHDEIHTAAAESAAPAAAPWIHIFYYEPYLLFSCEEYVAPEMIISAWSKESLLSPDMLSKAFWLAM